ncbi:MAG TPA: phosphatase PAP2 family protein [Chitinophagaceae bacterium]|nr:phosphatase PAP2 family protein [Chitinophagaceae bacterium]
MIKRAIVFACFLLPFVALSQKPDTLIKKLDSLSRKTDSAGGQNNNINAKAYNENTKFTIPVYFILLGSDLKQEITAPFHFTKKDWKRTVEFGIIEGSLFFVDEPVQKFALDLRDHNAGVRNVGKFISMFGGTYETYLLASLGAYGFILKNEKIKTTTLLATQAYITGAAMESLGKLLSGRQRPAFFEPNQTDAEPKFRGPFSTPGKDINGNRVNSSFPSGHTTVAFAAATVFAMEYKDRPLVPIFAYSAASLIGLSRITENKHWITDVVAGAALGYLTGRQVVNNYHRYAKLKAPKQKKNSISFNLQYNYGKLMPGMVYSF